MPVRRATELAEVDGLVIPGGESSVMDKLSRAFDLAEPVKAAIAGGMPVYGTCAGLIMLADRVLDAIVGQQSSLTNVGTRGRRTCTCSIVSGLGFSKYAATTTKR